MNTLFQRLKEPSTWAGLSVLAAMGGVQLDNEALQAWQGLAYLFAGGAGAASVVLPERGKKT